MKNLTQYLIRNKQTGLYAISCGTSSWYSFCFNNKEMNLLADDYFNNQANNINKDDGWGDMSLTLRVFNSQRSAYLFIRSITNKMNRRWQRQINNSWAGSNTSQMLIAVGKYDRKEWLKEILLNTEIVPVISAVGQPEDWKQCLPKYLKKLIP